MNIKYLVKLKNHNIIANVWNNINVNCYNCYISVNCLYLFTILITINIVVSYKNYLKNI